MRFRKILVALVLAGCGPQIETETDFESESNTATEITELCSSEPAVEAGFKLVSELQGTMSSLQVDCEVMFQESDAEGLAVGMTCSDGIDTGMTLLRIWATPESPEEVFPPDVKLHFVDSSGLNLHQWIRVETEFGDLVFAASMAYQPAPEDIDIAEWYHPLTVESQPSECVHDDSLCGPRERLLLRWSGPEDNWDIVGPNTASIGRYSMWVQEAAQFVEPPPCLDISNSYFRMAVMVNPS